MLVEAPEVVSQNIDVPALFSHVSRTEVRTACSGLTTFLMDMPKRVEDAVTHPTGSIQRPNRASIYLMVFRLFLSDGVSPAIMSLHRNRHTRGFTYERNLPPECLLHGRRQGSARKAKPLVAAAPARSA
jgi:hypothetical protein